MERQLGNIRLHSMRVVFLLTFIGLAPTAWPELLTTGQLLEPFYGVAVSFWAALALFAILGLLQPQAMIPLLLLQFCYKLIWLLTVGLPSWMHGEFGGAVQELAIANAIGVILDLLVIPWRYVAKSFLRRPAW